MLHGLHFRLSVIIALLAIAPLILVGALVGQRSVASLKRQSYALERGLVAGVGIEIRGVIDGWENQLRLLDRVQGLGMLEPAEQRTAMSNLMQHERLLQEIALVNLEGQELIRLSRSNVILADDLKSRAGSDVFEYPISGNGTYFGLQFDENIQEQLLTISIPLFDLRTGGIRSILVAEFRYKTIGELLAESAFPNGVDVYVVDPAGRVVAHRNPSMVLIKTTLDLSRHADTTKGLSGMDVLVAEERLRFGNQEMVVVAEQPVDLAFQLANESMRILVIVTSVVLAVAIIVAALVARQIVRPIKALAISALAVSSGDLSRQVEVRSRDEVGQFATAFNEMVSRLRDSRETLEESERRYRLLADNVAAIMSDGIWIRDLVDLHPMYFSPSVESLSSAAVGEAMVQTTEESFTPAAIESTKIAIEAQLALESVEGHVPGWSHTLEYEMVRKNGSMVWIETKMRFLRDPDGRPEALVGVTRDITERKRWEQALMESEEEARQLAEENAVSAEIGRIISSSTEIPEILDRVSEQASKLIPFDWMGTTTVDLERGTLTNDDTRGIDIPGRGQGYQVPIAGTLAEEMIRSRSNLVVHAEHETELADRYSALIPSFQAGLRSFLAVLLVFNDQVIGTLHLRSLQSNAYSDRHLGLAEAVGRQIAGAITRSRLYTESKRAEEQLKTFAADLERSNRELQEFAYVASHDMQEPLRKVEAFGDRLKTKYGDVLTGQGQDYLEQMLNASGRMRTLINDLLSFSRVTTKAQPFVSVDLAELVAEVESDLEATIEQVGGRVEVSDLPTIHADPTHMRQLFQNLIGNALKFQRPGEPPVVKVQQQCMANSSGNGDSNIADDSACQVVVEDNGIGFDEKYLDRIFNVFQRLHGRDQYEGTGVGLAVCRKIAERHGGAITASSVPGEGAKFIVTLPAQQPEEESGQRTNGTSPKLVAQ